MNMQNLNGKSVVSILRPAQVGERVAELLGDPRYTHGVAYSFRSDSNILPLDL
jgi:hypothetical protein